MTTENKPARRRLTTPPKFDLWDQTEVENELRGFNTFISLILIVAMCLGLLAFCTSTHAYDYYEAERRADERQAEAERRADERQREADRRADDRVFWQNEERKSREYLYRYETILNDGVRRDYPRRGW